MRSRVLAAIVILCLSIPVILAAMNGNKTAEDTSGQSRWAKVDLSQYCGKPVGELIDTLGNDFHDFGCYYPFNGLSAEWCAFSYPNSSITIYSKRMTRRDSQEDEITVIEFWGVLIAGIVAEFYKEDERVIESTISAIPAKSDDFALDYPKYVGRPIDHLLKDLPHPPDDSVVSYHWDYEIDTIDYKPYGGTHYYLGCIFYYSDEGVSIEIGFEDWIPHPPANPGRRITDASYFLGYEAYKITVYISCDN